MMQELTDEEYLMVMMTSFGDAVAAIARLYVPGAIAVYKVESKVGYEFSFGKVLLYASLREHNGLIREMYYYLDVSGNEISIGKTHWDYLKEGRVMSPVIISAHASFRKTPRIVSWNYD